MDQLEKAAEQRIKEGKLSAKEKELYVEKKLEPWYTLCESTFHLQYALTDCEK